MTLDEFFDGHSQSRQLFDAVLALMDVLGSVEYVVTKSQVAFRRKRPFAWAWIPGKYLRGQVAPLVLTFSFPNRDPSPRWKEIVEPARGRFIHHLELYTIDDIDDEVTAWLQLAWSWAAEFPK